MKTSLKLAVVALTLCMASQSFALFMPGIDVPPLTDPEDKVQLDAEFVIKPRRREMNESTATLNIRSHRLFKAVIFFKQDINLDLIDDFYLTSPFDDAVPFLVKDKDVNNDGFMDLICYFFVREVFPVDAEIQNGELFDLTMSILYDGELFSFGDSVIAKVPKKQSKKRFWWFSWRR